MILIRERREPAVSGYLLTLNTTNYLSEFINRLRQGTQRAKITGNIVSFSIFSQYFTVFVKFLPLPMGCEGQIQSKS